MNHSWTKVTIARENSKNSSKSYKGRFPRLFLFTLRIRRSRFSHLTWTALQLAQTSKITPWISLIAAELPQCTTRPKFQWSSRKPRIRAWMKMALRKAPYRIAWAWRIAASLTWTPSTTYWPDQAILPNKTAFATMTALAFKRASSADRNLFLIISLARAVYTLKCWNRRMTIKGDKWEETMTSKKSIWVCKIRIHAPSKSKVSQTFRNQG